MELSNIKDFGADLIKLYNTIELQEITIVEYKLKSAKYKALFNGYEILSEKLDKQLKENYYALRRKYDEFCFIPSGSVYMTLEDMVTEGIISESEYEFCTK